ncbi:MAG: S-layer homology domain-containing protein [Acidimicrobiia bacterium]|nr:S-layer homology domain-containing protein [Acidimicrobiia bacterium]MYK56729.1 S-layer homology domain-containing protein [Acidimicrobiia bacterium]
MPTGHIAERAIHWAAANGITAGVGNNRFGLGQTLTRYEMVTFSAGLLILLLAARVPREATRSLIFLLITGRTSPSDGQSRRESPAASAPISSAALERSPASRWSPSCTGRRDRLSGVQLETTLSPTLPPTRTTGQIPRLDGRISKGSPEESRQECSGTEPRCPGRKWCCSSAERWRRTSARRLNLHYRPA